MVRGGRGSYHARLCAKLYGDHPPHWELGIRSGAPPLVMGLGREEISIRVLIELEENLVQRRLRQPSRRRDPLEHRQMILAAPAPVYVIDRVDAGATWVP